MATLTREALRKSSRKTSPDTPSTISLPESECGAIPCASPDGLMTDLFGREVVLAPASQRQARAEGLTTLVTSGLIGRDSSASASLQRSLENRLMTQLDTAGSTLFKLTWKGRTTPLGRRYLERAASGHRTSGNGCTSWPTPKLPKRSHDLAKFLREPGRTTPTDLESAVTLAGWNTPISNDSEKRGIPIVGAGLAGSVHLATWAIPKARDWKDTQGMALTATNLDGSERDRTDRLSAQSMLTVSGEMRIGYSARDGIVTIGNGAQLNPAHSRWLQGLPRVFCDCAVTAMQSVRRSRQSSSRLHACKRPAPENPK